MRLLLILSLFALAGCSTPMTMLKNPKTGQVARCGGDITGSLAGGLIGYELQKGDAKKCVYSYQTQGFRIIEGAP